MSTLLFEHKRLALGYLLIYKEFVEGCFVNKDKLPIPISYILGFDDEEENVYLLYIHSFIPRPETRSGSDICELQIGDDNIIEEYNNWEIIK